MRAIHCSVSAGGMLTLSDPASVHIIKYMPQVIPEFDVPGHTGGWMALVPRGLQYCGSFPAHEERPQLYHDPNNMTLNIVTALLHEMSTLFPDQYFNVGADETFQYENQVSK